MSSICPHLVTIPIGLELTFIPNKKSKWKEYRSKTEARVAAAQFNSLIGSVFKSSSSDGTVTSPPFHAKADPFRVKYSIDPPQPHNSWCIEIGSQPLELDDWVSGKTATSSSASSPSELSSSRRANRAPRKPLSVGMSIQAIYFIAQSLNLYPHIEVVDRKTGKVTDYPTGGGHIHTNISGFFPYGENFLKKMAILEEMLCLDYANNPWIRWLFSQWSDNSNSQIALRRSDLVDMVRKKNRAITREQWNGATHSLALSCHAIRARFAATGKPVYPTYEWRFFDMPRNAEELRLQLAFLFAWLKKRIRQVEALFTSRTDAVTFDKIWQFYNQTILRVSIDAAQFDGLAKDTNFARAVIRGTMLDFGMSPSDMDGIFDAFWDRNYLRRMKYGKPL